MSNTYRAGILSVSLEDLAELLSLPPGTRIERVSWDFEDGMVKMVVKGDERSSLPKVAEGSIIPSAVVRVTTKAGTPSVEIR